VKNTSQNPWVLTRGPVKAAVIATLAGYAITMPRASADTTPQTLNSVTVTLGGNSSGLYQDSRPCSEVAPAFPGAGDDGKGGCSLNINNQPSTVSYTIKSGGQQGPASDPNGIPYDTATVGSNSNLVSASWKTTPSFLKLSLDFGLGKNNSALIASQYLPTGQKQMILGVGDSDGTNPVPQVNSTNITLTSQNSDAIVATIVPVPPQSWPSGVRSLTDAGWCAYPASKPFIFTLDTSTAPDPNNPNLVAFGYSFNSGNWSITSNVKMNIGQVTISADCPPTTTTPSPSPQPPASGGSGGGGAIDGMTLLALSGACAAAALRRRQNLAYQLRRKPLELNVA
jgi:hypothetical protein